MVEYDFQAIVVGAGLAGSSCALRLAKAGKEVLLVERGEPVGSKNLSGGVLWGHDMAELFPTEGDDAGEPWYEQAPVERHITEKKVGFLAKEDAFLVDWKFADWAEPPYNAFSVLRARLDAWLADKVEEADGFVIPGVAIEDFSRNEEGVADGVIQDGEAVRAPIVVLADGSNSRLTLAAGFRSQYTKEDLLLGVKEIIKLGEEKIDERFNCQNGSGVATEHVIGYLPDGLRSGGFLYTNKDTLSVGIVIQMETLPAGVHTYDIIDEFKEHPYIDALIDGGETVEYGAHWVPEGGYHGLPRIQDRGLVAVGDAAGFVLSNGMQIQGMNYAIHSGILAADAIIEAGDEPKDVSACGTSYEAKIKNSYIYKDLKRFKKVHKITKNPRVFDRYPQFIADVFRPIMTETGDPKDKTLKYVKRSMKKNKVSKVRLAMDGLAGRHL